MKISKSSYPLVILQSALIWSAIPVMWSFMPAYFNLNGFSASQVGFLMAINPVIAILFQPFIGIRVDRATSKNKIFALLMLGSILLTLILSTAHSAFLVTFGIIILMSFFQASLTPISESITLESLEHLNKSYAPSRMAGTIGYSVSAVALGYLIGIKTEYLFYAVMVICAVHIGIMLKMPTVKGHQTHENRVHFKALFEDKLLVLFYAFSVIGSLLMSFFYTFFPISFLSLGGTSDQLGMVFFISAMFEIPFLLFADRIVEKLGNQMLLLLSMFMVGLRILLLIFVTDSIQIYAIASMNGLAFIVFNYVIAVYINKTVRKELRTTGQTLLAVSMGIGRIVGTLCGGLLIDTIGMNLTSILSFGLSVLAMIGFVMGSKLLKKSKTA